MDAIALLKQDHELVKRLLEEATNAGEGQIDRKRQLVEQIFRELMVHERLEEDLFYPAFKEAANSKGKDLVAEGYEEHHVVDLVMEEMQDVDLDERKFDAKLKVMRENVEHHVKEEEEQMFPKARQALGDARIQELGREMLELKESLERQAPPRREQSA